MKVIARNSNLLGKITILVMVSFVVNTALALDGSGTEEDPWRIKSLEDFNDFAADANYWAGFTRLETDVNLGGRVYTTAVIAPAPTTAFTGIFDGNDHKIENLTINGGTNDFLGLFGYISNGEVRNLGIEECSVSGTGDYVGGLVGRNGGHDNQGSIIMNCYSIGSVSGYQYVGGLVGAAYDSSVSNCYSTGFVSGYQYVGGLVGRIVEASVSNSYSISSVSGDWSVGGLVGTDSDASVTNCYSNGDVNGTQGYVGGLMGSNSYGDISNCYSTSDVKGSGRYVGGLVGWTQASGVSNCYSTGDVKGSGRYVGGLVGGNQGGISHCCSTGETSGDNYIGGLVGFNNHGTVYNCYTTGNVGGYSTVGGLVGGNEGKLSNCYSTGDVRGDDVVGGSVGSNYWNKTISNCFWDTYRQTHGVTESIGLNEGIVINVAGLLTAQMQTRSTFTDANWDFISETVNGTEDIWTIHEEVDYPKFVWKLVNFIGWYEVDFLDLAFFANHWLENNCGVANDCDGADLDFSDKVDEADMKIFFDHWLEGVE